jgi:hypothetical protein
MILAASGITPVTGSFIETVDMDKDIKQKEPLF